MASTIHLKCKQLPLPSTSSSPNSRYRVNRRRHFVCKATADEASSADVNSPPWSRMGVSITVVAANTLLFGYKGRSEANAAFLEAEEDQELLEKVKKDRKKWRQGVIQSLDNETVELHGEEKVEVDNFNINPAYLIDSVDKNDIPTAKASFVAVASAFKNSIF